MNYFVMPYVLMFHDSMAYGTHHFLTNFKFQCVIREHLLFENILNVGTSEGKLEFDKLVLLTQQGYCRNLAPVRVGEKVAIILSLEEPTLSTVRFCFRVVRYDGVPVTCGFQTVVCVSSETNAVIPAPPLFFQHGMQLMERLESPSFAERILSGRTKEVFDPEILKLAIEVANAEPNMSHPRYVTIEDSALVAESPVVVPENFSNRIVFMFPGQGSYAPRALRDLFHSDSESALLIQKANAITQQVLNSSILELITADNSELHNAFLEKAPELAQVGMYLGSVLVARHLIKKGLKPGCIVGHSAGELAALAIAGVYSDEVGLEIMCNRIRALQSLNGNPGGMLAVFCTEERTRSILNDIQQISLQIAIINHAEQAVVSGSTGDLQVLHTKLKSLGIQSIMLKTRYPFHSNLLEPAVSQFESFLKKIKFTSPEIPIYSPIERGFYTTQSDMAHLLASHFTRSLNFPDAIFKLSSSGGHTFIECGGGNVLSKLVRRILSGVANFKTYSPLASGSTAIIELNALLSSYAEGDISIHSRDIEEGSCASNSKDHAEVEKTEAAVGIPIAIISQGCVLPSAENPQEFWQNILEGRSGISNAGELRPDVAKDFLVNGEVVSDKTYSLLGGFVRNLNPDIKGLPYNKEEFLRLTSAQRFLSLAMNQCLEGKAKNIPAPHRIHIYLGSTGDGISEYDEALLLASLHHEVDSIQVAQDKREEFHQVLNMALGSDRKDIIAPHANYSAVAEKHLGQGVKIMCVDAACASSLYAIDLGLNALRQGECDIAFCGGVFAPGPANSCLFSQFGGLSATGSRPLDASADGVVFGEGAALLALKRLPDALAANDKIYAVIRGSGLSNDGKSSSVAVPRRQGQVIAFQRAYEETGISTDDIQYVEAHATATTVGDIEEFSALRDFFNNNENRRGSIELGSVKALTGHTGWLSGAVSIIKMVQALNAKVIPPQSNFALPNPNFDLVHSPFKISVQAKPWPENGSKPRRVGIDGFGFGGSNAHVIMEEYVHDYHNSRWGMVPTLPILPQSKILAVVGIDALFPFKSESVMDENPVLRFDRDSLKLPKGFLILPDVVDHLDRGQLLAFLVAFNALKSLKDKWKAWKSSLGVVLGVEGKSGLGITINKRIYIDFLNRRLNELSRSSSLSESDFLHIKNELIASLRRIRPSGPYTLPGLMPNVTAGRVGNLLDLNGPNFVIDSGSFSLFEALSTAESLLHMGKAQMVLAGGINGYAGPEVQFRRPSRNGSRDDDRPVAEGAVTLALAYPDFARIHKLPVLAEIEIIGKLSGSIMPADTLTIGEETPYRLNGAEGALELVRAIREVGKDKKQIDLIWPVSNDRCIRRLRVYAPGIEKVRENSFVIRPTEVENTDIANPIYFCTPTLTACDQKDFVKPYRLQRGRVMILADQNSWQKHPEAQAVLNEMEPTFLCPAAHAVTNAISIDLSSDNAISESLKTIDFSKYDTILVIKDLQGISPFDSVIADGGTGEGLLALMFAVVRQGYERLKAGHIVLGTLCLNAPAGDHAHPYSGLLSGFVKAIARELPQTSCKALATDTASFRQAVNQIEVEWGTGPLPASAVIVYKGSKRFEYTLQRLRALSSSDGISLKSDSIVVATGGGRGVTAVLIEELARVTGCTVILLGRTSLAEIPEHVLAMSQKDFDAHETVFYREEMKSSPDVHIRDLKKRYEHFRNAREIQDTLLILNRLSKNVEYIPVDITNETAVDTVMKRFSENFKKIDLIIHGAGIQVSKNSERKKIEEFQSIVATKIGGLGNLYHSFKKHFPGQKTHFHLITSVFSYFGNDGQPDYGAANEAMNHIADWMGAIDTECEWTTLGWLGWAGIGMTKGSEWVVLQQYRKLRAVTKEEGQAIFLDLLQGKPLAHTHLMISDGEMSYFNMKLSEDSSTSLADKPSPSAHPRVNREIFEKSWNLSLNSHPYILDHIVGGRPTYPGSFEVELAVQTAQSLTPNLRVVSLENTNLIKFIRFTPNSDMLTVRGRAETLGDTLIRVQLLSDFVHRSGKILRKDIVHFETTIHMSSIPNAIDPLGTENDVIDGMKVSDPYLSTDAFVRLRGFFDCLEDIEIGAQWRKGTFKIKETNMLSLLSTFQVPSIMLDALFRFSMINVTDDDMAPLYIPLNCREIHIAPDINDLVLATSGDKISFFGTNPRIDGEMSHNDWVQARNQQGRILLMARDCTALKANEVAAEKLERV